jgi:predicted AAA+ superfamily ATPase
VDRVFAPAFELPKASGSAETDVLDRLLLGGYPEAVARKSAERRYAWFDSYVTTILARDVRDLANIEKIAEIPRLLALLASRLAELVNQEVDLILEDAAGRIVGIEVKAAVSLDAHYLRGLKTLAELSGQRFLRGIVFYLGEAVVPFGKDLWAVPVSMAWT